MQQQPIFKSNYNTVELKDLIIDAILDKKGEELVSLDLRKIDESVTDFFLVCHATTTTQVKAIAENILIRVKETTGEHPWHKEGMENLEWVLIDYVDIVVHIFTRDKRTFYQLEELWSDAPQQSFNYENPINK